MSFIRTRTIKGRKYRYLEKRWREGGKVRSQSIYLGYADGLLGGGDAIPDHGRGQHGLEALQDQAEAMQAAKETPADEAGAKEAATPASSTESHSSEADASDSGASPQ